MNFPITLNDILKIESPDQFKIRFLIDGSVRWDPLRLFNENQIENLIIGHYWNYNKKRAFKIGDKTLGFVRIEGDRWLFFHAGEVTKDLGKMNGCGYDYSPLSEFEKYTGRLIIRYHNNTQNLIRKANSVLEKCFVEQILPDIFNQNEFPGYDKVSLTWHQLKIVVQIKTWETAFSNQKGIYLITDKSNGKMYVGSAYGDNMILGRWRQYAINGHGNNIELKKIPFDYIKDNFNYSILEIYKSTTSNEEIISRETWWKQILSTRKFGYNLN